MSGIMAVLLGFSLLALFFPHKNEPVDEHLLALNRKRYITYNSLSVIPFFIFMGLIGWMFYSLGHSVNDWVNPAQPLKAKAEGVIWMMPTSALSFGLVGFPMTLLYRILLRNQYPVFMEALNREYGWNGMRIWKPIAITLTLVGTISFMLLLDVYMRVDGDKLIINEFLDMKDNEYHLRDITEIAHFTSKEESNGDIVSVDFYVLFINGTEFFNSEHTFVFTEGAEFPSILDHIASVNNFKISERELYKE